MLLSFIIGRHYNRVDYPLGAIGGYFALAMALFAAMNYIGNAGDWKSLALNTVLLLIYIAAIAFNERAMIGKIAKKVLRK